MNVRHPRLMIVINSTETVLIMKVVLHVNVSLVTQEMERCVPVSEDRNLSIY